MYGTNCQGTSMKLKRSLRSRIGWTNVKIGAFKASASSALHLQVQVRLLRTSGLSREQRGLGRLKLTRTPLSRSKVKVTVSGLFAPRYFRSSERKFPVGTFAPGNESSQWEPSIPGANVPGNFRSWYSQFAF